MSVQFPQAVADSSADVQIWDNAAFDNGEVSEDLTANKQSWGSLTSVFENPKASFDSVSDKENRGNVNQISSDSFSPKSSIATSCKRASGIRGFEKSKIRDSNRRGIFQGDRDEKVIDNEIEEIESEILRLNLKLEALRLEKAEKSVKVVEKKGRIVAAKFLEPKSGVKYGGDCKKQGEEVSSRTKVLRRSVSLGPGEILSAGRRGMSIGPSEILGAAKVRNLSKQELVTPLQSRRKSCFWKLQEIDEEKVMCKERGKSSSVSPKSKKVGGKPQVPRQAVTTIASRKTMKKEESVVNAIQPKKLFKEGEKSAPATNKKAVMRAGRVVASRYNQGTSQSSAMRKRSLPESDKDDGKRCDKKRSLSAGKSRSKKHWEIPNEIIVHGSDDMVKPSPKPVVNVPDLLPKLRIVRCASESPRDSGPAKKVAELIGRKSFFSNDEEDENPAVCQVLDYSGDEAE